MQYRLRTLLIVLALAPPLLAVSYWAWKKYDATRWRVIQGGGPVYLLPNKPGYHWESDHYDGWREVLNETTSPANSASATTSTAPQYSK